MTTSADFEQRHHGGEHSRARAGDYQITRADRRSRHIAHDMRIETQVHQTHAKSLHHETLAADTVTCDAAGAQDFVAHPIGSIRRQRAKHRSDLRERPVSHSLHAMTGLSALGRVHRF